MIKSNTNPMLQVQSYISLEQVDSGRWYLVILTEIFMVSATLQGHSVTFKMGTCNHCQQLEANLMATSSFFTIKCRTQFVPLGFDLSFVQNLTYPFLISCSPNYLARP